MITLSAINNDEEIRNWTAFNGYLGDSFRIAAVKPTYVAVETPKAQNIQNIPSLEFQMIDQLWYDYISGRVRLLRRHFCSSLKGIVVYPA